MSYHYEATSAILDFSSVAEVMGGRVDRVTPKKNSGPPKFFEMNSKPVKIRINY